MLASSGRYPAAFPATPTRPGTTAINNTQTTPNGQPLRTLALTPSRYVPPSPNVTKQDGPPQFASLPTRLSPEDGQCRALVDRDQASLDATLRAVREGKSERRRRHEGVKVELIEEERKWEMECERLRREGADVVKGGWADEREQRERSSSHVGERWRERER